MRDELMATGALSTMVGVGQPKGLVTPQLPAMRPGLAVVPEIQHSRFTGLLPEQLGNCGDRETPDPPILACRELLAGRNVTRQNQGLAGLSLHEGHAEIAESRQTSQLDGSRYSSEEAKAPTVGRGRRLLVNVSQLSSGQHLQHRSTSLRASIN